MPPAEWSEVGERVVRSLNRDLQSLQQHLLRQHKSSIKQWAQTQEIVEAFGIP